RGQAGRDPVSSVVCPWLIPGAVGKEHQPRLVYHSERAPQGRLLPLHSWTRSNQLGGRALQDVFPGRVAAERLAKRHAGVRLQRQLDAAWIEELLLQSSQGARLFIAN